MLYHVRLDALPEKKSPVAGVVGAVPFGIFNPAPVVVEAAVVSFFVKVFAPANVCASPSVATVSFAVIAGASKLNVLFGV